MRKVFFWLVGVPLAVLIAVFAASNLKVIDVYIWPFPYAVGMPVYFLFLGSLAIGLVSGAVLMWLSVLGLRVKVYNREMEIKSLKRSLDRSAVEHQKLLEKANRQAKALPPAA